MARGFFNDQTIEIPCPNCGKKIAKPIGWIESHKHLPCPICNVNIELEASQFIREIRKAENAIADFTRSINKTIRL